MASSQTATIDSITKANRFLSGLGGNVGFSDAIKRVRERSEAAIAEQLQGLEHYVGGDTSAKPAPELALIGDVVRHAPDGTDTSRAIGAASDSLRDAGELADYVRGGLITDLAYIGLLLLVTVFVSVLWITSIGPEFTALFSGFGNDLPAMSQFVLDQSWVMLAATGGVTAAIAAIVIGVRRMAVRIENVAPAGSGLLGRVLGPEVRRAHERWRMLTIANAWAAGGRSALEATRHAGSKLEVPQDVAREVASALDLADELESAESELHYQVRESIEKYRQTLEWRRAVGFRLLQVIVAVMVGFIVISVYLPIFKMGAVV